MASPFGQFQAPASKIINPKPSMPAEYFDRSVDRNPTAQGGGGGAGGDITLPFKITDTSPDISTPTINVVYGTVMDIEPTDIATDIAITDDNTNTVYLDNTLDTAGNVTASAVTVGTSGLPSNSTSHAYLLIGVCVVASGAITTSQSLYFSQGFKACDRDEAADPPVDGTYEFFVR